MVWYDIGNIMTGQIQLLDIKGEALSDVIRAIEGPNHFLHCFLLSLVPSLLSLLYPSLLISTPSLYHTIQTRWRMTILTLQG
jgi:hypothetical protein